jgi:hypothetical protein
LPILENVKAAENDANEANTKEDAQCQNRFSMRMNLGKGRSPMDDSQTLIAMAGNNAVIPSESRGIPMRKLKGNFAGSLGFARDDRLCKFTAPQPATAPAIFR